jgi:hypothetical protein
MKYDFVEIGTSNFDTLIENASDQTVGISIEPISHYLNQLPDKPNVKKLNYAISDGEELEIARVYYVPENIIERLNLPHWLKGCNTINDFHFQHSNLNVKKYVDSFPVINMPIKMLFKMYEITELDYLKIDTEGYDVYLLQSLFEYLQTVGKLSYPKSILFESNGLTDSQKVLDIIEKYKTLGYKLIFSEHETLIRLV